MALNFPNSPTLGQQYANFVWDGASWLQSETLPGGLPAGSIIQWGGSTAPANWLLCDGSVVSRSTYASLFSAIGTTYGAGDGSSTFQLPDLRGRVAVGKNGGSFGTLGATGGVESVTLTAAQSGLPAHNHTQNAHNHTQDPHSHGGVIIIGGISVPQGSYYGSYGQYGTTNTSATTATNQATTATNNPNTAADAEQSHTNVQPYQVVNYIIKATAASTPGDSELATRVQPVTLGGTGSTSLSAGSYLKGNGTNAVAVQSGVPATDLTGTIDSARLPTIPTEKMPTGTILQVVSKSDGVAYAATVSTNVWITWPSSRMQLSITPKSASSKILVIVNADLGNNSNDAAMRLLRNSTAIGVGTPPGTGNQLASAVTGMLYASDSNHQRRVVTVNYLDSPGTTSAVTYDVQFSSEGNTMFLNRAPAGSYQNGTYIFAAIGVSTITLMEVAG